MRLNSEVSTSLHVLHLRYHYDTTIIFIWFFINSTILNFAMSMRADVSGVRTEDMVW